MLFYEYNYKDIDIICIVCAPKSEDNICIDYSAQPPYNEIFFKFEGDNTFHHNGVHANIQKNTIGFLPKNNHKIDYTIEVKKASSSINIFFLSNVELPETAQFVDCSDIPNITSLFIKMSNIWNAQKTGYYEETLSLFHKILALLQIHFASNYIPQKKYDLISDSVKYIEQHYLNESIKTEELAAMSGISVSYYKKIFQKKFGITPNQYLNKLKINYACSLLKTHHYTVTQISEMAGYSSVYYFTYAFKKHTGISPSEYAKHIVDENNKL